MSHFPASSVVQWPNQTLKLDKGAKHELCCYSLPEEGVWLFAIVVDCFPVFVSPRKKPPIVYCFDEQKKTLLMFWLRGTEKAPLFNAQINCFMFRSRGTEKSTMSSEGTSVVKMVITSEVISTTPLFCVFDKILHFSQNSVFLIFSLFLRQKSLF